ncbi:MAG: HAMP domain-containing sensor histidine kinase [Kofleriaceae bacterium]
MATSASLAALAHDLRAPLTVIAGTAAALRSSVDAGARAGFDRILQETHRVSRMLENRVAASRIADPTSLRREWVPVEELIGDALAPFDGLIAGRIELAVPPTAMAHVDVRLCQLLLGNLIDNALRYGPGSDMAIRVKCGHAEVVIDIEDTGPGMPGHVGFGPVELDRGKGLAVANAIALAHGGWFAVIPREHGGTSVRTCLPDGEARPSFAVEEDL